MLLPDFCIPHFDRLHCRKCRRRVDLGSDDIRGAGLLADASGKPHRFEFDALCPACGGEITVKIGPPLEWPQVLRWMYAVCLTAEQLSGASEEKLRLGPMGTKMMTYLDAAPARADMPERGEAVAIITCASGDELEAPMMFSVADTERLTVALLTVLAHFGNERAGEVVKQWFEDKDD